MIFKLRLVVSGRATEPVLSMVDRWRLMMVPWWSTGLLVGTGQTVDYRKFGEVWVPAVEEGFGWASVDGLLCKAAVQSARSKFMTIDWFLGSGILVCACCSCKLPFMRR